MPAPWTCVVLLLPFMFEGIYGRTFSIGPAAEHKCRRVYQKNCDPGRVCALQHYHAPFNMTRAVCLPDFLMKTETNPCDLQPDHGKCGARYIRWYYHKGHGACKWFHYGGCEGNQNNFKLRQECESLCKRDENSEGNSAHRRKNSISLPVIPPRNIKVSEPVYNPKRSNVISPPIKMRKLLDLRNERRRILKLGKKKHRRETRRENRRFSKNKKKRRNGKIRRKGKKFRKNRRRRKNQRRRKNRRKHKKHKNKKRENIEVTTVTVPIEKVTRSSQHILRTMSSESTRTNNISPRKVLTVKKEKDKNMDKS